MAILEVSALAIRLIKALAEVTPKELSARFTHMYSDTDALNQHSDRYNADATE